MAEDRAQRRLAAILAADVVGYSRLMEADEAGTLAALKARRKNVLQPIVARHHGRIVKLMGDGVLIEFGSAVDSVECASRLQEAMAAANAGLSEEWHIVLRIGVNLGDVVVEGGDLYGDGVNVAARLEALAEPGSILVSGTIYDQVRNKAGVAFADAGTRPLKNIAEPVRTYHVAGTPVVAVAAIERVSDKPSIAILPFTNMSGDPEQTYFSDGITEDIITELSRFRSLFVIARNSSFQFRDKSVDMKRVGRELGVQYLVEGSIRRASDRVRVTVQLIDARTGNHLWADRFDRDFADIFAVQDEVTRCIVTSIEPVLAAESLRMAKRKPPEDVQSYDCFLKAKELLAAAQTSQELREARALCDHALRIDPTFARAHAFRSMSFTLGVMTIEADDLNEWRRRALLSAEQAVALDGMDAVNHLALAWASFVNVQRDRTLAHCAKAISLNSNDADALVDAAFFHGCYGHHDRTLQHLEAAQQRNPSNLHIYSWTTGCIFYLLGQYGDALAAFEAFGQPNENIHLWRAASLIKLGRNQEAQIDMQAVRALRPKLTAAMALDIFRYLPDCDDFVGALRQAGLRE